MISFPIACRTKRRSSPPRSRRQLHLPCRKISQRRTFPPTFLWLLPLQRRPPLQPPPRPRLPNQHQRPLPRRHLNRLPSRPQLRRKPQRPSHRQRMSQKKILRRNRRLNLPPRLRRSPLRRLRQNHCLRPRQKPPLKLLPSRPQKLLQSPRILPRLRPNPLLNPPLSRNLVRRRPRGVLKKLAAERSPHQVKVKARGTPTRRTPS